MTIGRRQLVMSAAALLGARAGAMPSPMEVTVDGATGLLTGSATGGPAASAGPAIPIGAAGSADPRAGGQGTDLRRLRFTLTLANPTPEVLKDQRVWVAMPLRRGATQQLADLRVSVPHRVEHDALNQTLLRIDWPLVPPMAVRVISVQADVRVHAGDPAAGVGAGPAAGEWLAPERFIESDDPAIRALGARLAGATPRATLDAIYDWVRHELRYAGYLADSLGAREALSRRSGDCTEYACLVVALARANGIPARWVGGYVAGGSIAPRPQDYHDWAEVHLDGVWQPLDAQKECWQRDARDYVVFRIHRDPPVNALGTAHRFLVEGALTARM